jgi:surface protein
MFLRASAFNQDISPWNTSQVTDMRYMFKEAAAFYQDITGWSTTSLTGSGAMFAGTTAWLDRVQRGDGTASTAGPISEWVHKPCLIDERVQSGWCVPCEYNHVNAEGDDPAASVDTACDELTCCESKMRRVGMIIKRK